MRIYLYIMATDYVTKSDIHYWPFTGKIVHASYMRGLI